MSNAFLNHTKDNDRVEIVFKKSLFSRLSRPKTVEDSSWVRCLKLPQHDHNHNVLMIKFNLWVNPKRWRPRGKGPSDG